MGRSRFDPMKEQRLTVPNIQNTTPIRLAAEPSNIVSEARPFRQQSRIDRFIIRAFEFDWSFRFCHGIVPVNRSDSRKWNRFRTPENLATAEVYGSLDHV